MGLCVNIHKTVWHNLLIIFDIDWKPASNTLANDCILFLFRFYTASKMWLFYYRTGCRAPRLNILAAPAESKTFS